MKKMKKVLSLILTVIMVLAMAAPSFADEPGSITIEPSSSEGVVDATKYKAYKIFDVNYSGNNYSYEIDVAKNNSWYDIVNNYALKEGSGITLQTIASNPNKKTVVIDDELFSPSDFASYLKTELDKDSVLKETGSSFRSSGNNAVCTGLELGYYFVTSTTGALCNLTTTVPTATIRDKNLISFTKEAYDAEDNPITDGDVYVGQNITFKINGKVPDVTGFEEYIYRVTDTMTAGLTYNKDIVITVGEVSYDVEDDEISYTSTEHGFTLSIDVMNMTKDAPIVIEYTATVNENAVAKISENKAELTFGNEGNTMSDRVRLYTAKIEIDKYIEDKDDPSNTTNKLNGAKFVLYKIVDGAKKYYAEANGAVTWVDSIEDASVKETKTIGEEPNQIDGYAEFIGLEKGTYYLSETEAPAGYNLLDEDPQIVIDGITIANDNSQDTVVSEQSEVSQLVMTQRVANSTGVELPSTGGIGTTIFYAAGIVLMAGAVFFVVRRKRA